MGWLTEGGKCLLSRPHAMLISCRTSDRSDLTPSPISRFFAHCSAHSDHFTLVRLCARAVVCARRGESARISARSIDLLTCMARGMNRAKWAQRQLLKTAVLRCAWTERLVALRRRSLVCRAMRIFQDIFVVVVWGHGAGVYDKDVVEITSLSTAFPRTMSCSDDQILKWYRPWQRLVTFRI